MSDLEDPIVWPRAQFDDIEAEAGSSDSWHWAPMVVRQAAAQRALIDEVLSWPHRYRAAKRTCCSLRRPRTPRAHHIALPAMCGAEQPLVGPYVSMCTGPPGHTGPHVW